MKARIAGPLLACGVVLAVALFARARSNQQAGIAMPGDDPAALIEFSAVEKPTSRSSMRTWEATYRGRSGTARFDIEP